MPPAVAPWNYISSVYFGGFFSQTGIFAGFSLHIINLAVRISAAMMAGDITFFRVPNSFQGYNGMGRGAGNIIYKSLFGQMERYTPLAARVRA